MARGLSRNPRLPECLRSASPGFDPTADVTETAVRELGADRVLFGSDAPGRSFASQLGKVSGAEISDRDKEKILSGNLRKILEPVLKKRGFPV
jgi:predicted TIM-barrel fold metal-dependent hydrolase